MRIQQFKWMMLLLAVELCAGAARAVETLKLSFSGATATSVQVTQTANQKTESSTTWSPTLGTDLVFTTGGNKGDESGFLFAQTSGKTDCVAQGYLSVNCQLQSGQEDNWELRLPFTPSETVVVSGVTPGLNVFNGDQTAKNVNVELTCKVSILQGETAVVQQVSQSITASNSTSYAAVAIPFGSTVTLEQGTLYTLVVNVGSAQTYNTYAGIRDFVFHAPSSRTLTDATEAWNAAEEWTPALVPAEGEVTLTVETGVDLTMEADAALETLTVNEGSSEGEKSLTFSATGTPTLAVDTLHVNASTDLSTLTSTLKTVEIASEKTLSVGAGTTLSTAGDAAITGAGKLEVKGNLTLSGNNSYTGGTLIGEGATVTLGHKNALGTEGAITGSGTLLWNGVKPGNVNGLNDAAWTGTVKIQSWTEPTTGHSPLTLAAYGNADSMVELQAVKGYLSGDTTVEALKLTGEGLTFNNGTSTGFIACTINALEGAGQFKGAEGTANWGYNLLVKDAEAFTGTIDLSSERSQRVSVVFGTESALAQAGKIVIDAPVTIASGTTWKAINGIVLTANGEIKGGGTIASALTLASGATIDLTASPLSVTGDLTLPDAFTVKVSELPEATEWLSLWETSGTVTTSGTKVTVTDGETSAEYTLVNDNGVVELAPPPAVSYEQEQVTFSNKTANSIDLSDGWSLASLKKTDGTTDVSQMTTESGAVSQVATYFTPNINVGSGSGAPWVATFSAPEGGRCMDAVTFNFITFNGSGGVQTSGGNAANIKFDFTLSYVTLAGETFEVGTITGANLAGTGDAVPENAEQTFTFSKPVMVKQLILKADRNETYSSGCFVGLSSFAVGTYRGISAICEGTYGATPSTITFSDANTTDNTITLSNGWSLESLTANDANNTAATLKNLDDNTSYTIDETTYNEAQLFAPDRNVCSGNPWKATFVAPDGGVVMSAIKLAGPRYNNGGGSQGNDVQRVVKFTVYDQEGNKLATTGDITTNGATFTTETLTFAAPALVTKLIIVAEKGENEQNGCFHGLAKIDLTLYPSIPAQTVLVNPTAWAAEDQQLGAVFLGASAELPAAPEAFAGCYQAEVFRSLNADALTTWDIDALTSTGTAITFAQNAGVEMDCPLPEAQKPGTPSLGICFDTTPYLGKLGVETVDYIAPADSAILYVGSAEAQAAYAGEQWWSSATEGAPATQGALPEGKKPVLWLEGGTITMANAASEVALTFHEETTGGVIEIPEGVTLAYAASSEPSVSNPAIPEGVTVKLGGALTMAGTLPSVEVTSTTAVLGAAAGDNGDLTVNTIACEAGNSLTIATGNVTLTDPPETLALKLGGGNLALTDSANEAITVASLTVTAEGSALQLPEAGLTATDLALGAYPLTLEGALTVDALSGTGTITGEGSLTFTGTGSFTGSFDGIHLVVPGGASLTLSGTDSLMVATLSGAGELVLSEKKTLGLAQPSTYSGTIELQEDTWLLLDCDQMDSTVLTLANGAQLKDKTSTGGVKTGLNGEMLAVESGAAIVNPNNQIAAKVVFKEGAILDLSDGGALNVDAEVELPEGGAVVLKCVAPGNVLRYLGDAVPDLARFTLEDVSGSNALADGYLAAGSAYEQICVGVLSIARPEGAAFTDEQMQQMANDVFAATGVYGIEFSETLTLSDTAPFECFDGCATIYDWENEYTIKAQYSFGVADIRIAEKDGVQQVVLAVQVTDGVSKNAALRAGTEIRLSTDGGESYDEAPLTPLTDDELSAAGLENSEGVYWYWAEALPEIDAGETSKTVKYKVRAVNEGTSEASAEE